MLKFIIQNLAKHVYLVKYIYMFGFYNIKAKILFLFSCHLNKTSSVVRAS